VNAATSKQQPSAKIGGNDPEQVIQLRSLSCGDIISPLIPEGEFSMAKFAIGEKVDNAADDHEGGTVVAVFPTVEGNFRYAVDMEGYGALQFFTEEKLVVHR
jgi:hypothetical protein